MKLIYKELCWGRAITHTYWSATRQVAKPTEGPGHHAPPELTAPWTDLHMSNFKVRFTLSWWTYESHCNIWTNDAGASQEETYSSEVRPRQLLQSSGTVLYIAVHLPFKPFLCLTPGGTSLLIH